jgi:hypothetical protein
MPGYGRVLAALTPTYSKKAAIKCVFYNIIIANTGRDPVHCVRDSSACVGSSTLAGRSKGNPSMNRGRAEAGPYRNTCISVKRASFLSPFLEYVGDNIARARPYPTSSSRSVDPHIAVYKEGAFCDRGCTLRLYK